MKFEAAILKYAVWIDGDILEQFQQLTLYGRGDDKLMPQALREWLSAKDFKRLARKELQQLVQKNLLTIKSGV